jgi:hypothetical protein
LQDAIDCYRKYRSAKNREGKQTLHEAERWLMKDEDDWIFSFHNVCDLLGFVPEYIRRGLLGEKRRQASRPPQRNKPRRQAA